VNVASLSLMAVALAGAVLLIRWKVNSTWLVAGAALVGVLTHGLLR
jgi:hypothetical protein